MVNLIAAPMGKTAVRRCFPEDIRVETDFRIPLPDGRHLSARMWIPVSADRIPVPAVIEYAPFRHADFTWPRDAIIHPWFAGHGYASIRLEPAGSLESDGAPQDEYTAAEQDDCVDALAWIADQPWCSGTTGMFGMSWGAFSALQVAARRPPSLKAIIPVHGTDDRFGDDIHYMGGCLLTAGLAWGALYQTYMMRPALADIDGPDWQESWRRRMQSAPDILPRWMGHQSRDSYWKHASVCEDPTAIEAATYVICGWTDGYTNAALRMAQSLTCPHKVLIGPWGHTYPHIALPGPQIGFLQEATRWWDRWLKGSDNGADAGPGVVYYMQDHIAPATSHGSRDGRWIAEQTWPSPNVSSRRLWLTSGGGLAEDASAPGAALVRTPLATAMTGGEWLPHGVGPEMPGDQRGEDAGALCFDTTPLEADTEICGQPSVALTMAADTPKGTILARLCAVAPDGSSALITYGLLNLAHRNGFESAQDMIPGDTFETVVTLNNIAWVVPAGHRLRLAISTGSWPLVWPAAQNMTATIKTGVSQFNLPVRDADADDGPVRELGKAEIPPPPDLTWLREVNRERVLTRDLETDEQSRTYLKDDGLFVIAENNNRVGSVVSLTYSSRDEDPLSARADYRISIEMGPQNRPMSLDAEFTVTAGTDALKISGNVKARADADLICERQFSSRVPRTAI